MAAALIVMLFWAACVDTAECDATVPCEDGEACYDFACRPICATASDCRSTEDCAPCQQDDAEGTVDHCFEATDFVCLPIEEQ